MSEIDDATSEAKESSAPELPGATDEDRESSAPDLPGEAEEKSGGSAEDTALAGLIKDVNHRYHMLYSRVSSIALVSFLVVVVAASVTVDGWLTPLAIMIGMALLTLFLMRMAIHLMSRPLKVEVSDALAGHEITLDELLVRAREMPSDSEFFLSLVDGPLARQERERERARTGVDV